MFTQFLSNLLTQIPDIDVPEGEVPPDPDDSDGNDLTFHPFDAV